MLAVAPIGGTSCVPVSYINYISANCLRNSMFAQWFVRLGLGVVFGYMGVDKLLRPDIWLLQMPPALANLGTNFIFVLGAIEIILALMMLSNRFFRLAAFGCVVILSGAIMTLGINDIAARDVGLLFAALSLVAWFDHHMTPRTIMRGYVGLLKGKPHGGH